MDNFSEVKEGTTNKVRFSISPDGKIEFDSQGLEDWQLIDAINQTREVAKETRATKQKIQEIKSTSEIASHALILAFLTIVVSGASFTVSRLVSSHFNHSTQVEVAR